MRIRRMHLWLDVCRVVEQNVEDIVAFVFVGANDTRLNGHMIRHQAVGHDPLAKAEILRGMTGIERMNLGLELLAVTDPVRVELLALADSPLLIDMSARMNGHRFRTFST